jgi:choline dehydrogenase-like flavoprotein
VHDVIVVGSGPAGFAAATLSRGADVLVVDPGFAPAPRDGDHGISLLEAKRRGDVDVRTVIGASYESLQNLYGEYLSPKLKGPLMRFVTEGVERWTPLRSASVTARLSLARGGLANAWGAGAFRYDQRELRHFPFPAADLDRHYRALIEHIGVTGADDDLSDTFGSSDGHLPPPELNQAGLDLFARYAQNRAWLQRRGLRAGLPRLALLTREHRGRSAYQQDGMEFFRPHAASIFNPGHALLELVAQGRVAYRPGIVVDRFMCESERVVVYGRQVSDGSPITLHARRLALAAGALNTGRIVLASAKDQRRRLPFRDNLISFVPLVDPARLGASHDPNCLPAQAVLVLESERADPIQMTFYGVNATLWGDVAFDFPLPAPFLPAAVRALLPALRIVQIFYPDTGDPVGGCRLADDGALELDYQPMARGEVEAKIIRLMRRMGYLGLARLCKYPPPGSCYHFAGTVPMRRDPGHFETAPSGALFGAPGVFVLDAATFPALPSKNLTLTIMANSRRIAEPLLGARGPT